MTDVRLNARIESALRERIIDGRMRFGSRISDKSLAEELGASRTPVREALLALRSEGLVVLRPQSGTFVFDPGAAEIGAICQLRGIMEAGALRIASGIDRPAVVTELSEIVSAASVAHADGDLASCEAFDTRFHETLVVLSRNTYLVDAYRGISGKVRALRSRLPAEADRVGRAVAQHRRIVDLVAVGRVADAEAELTQHMQNVQAQLFLGGRATDAA